MTHQYIVDIGTEETAKLNAQALNASAADEALAPIYRRGQRTGLNLEVLPGLGGQLDSEGTAVVADQLLVWTTHSAKAIGALGPNNISGQQDLTPLRVTALILAPTPGTTVTDRMLGGMLTLRAAGVRVSFNHVLCANNPPIPPLESHMTAKGIVPPRATQYVLPSRSTRRPVPGLVQALRSWFSRLPWAPSFARRPLPVKVAVVDSGVHAAGTSNVQPRTDGWLNDVRGDDDPLAAGLAVGADTPGAGHGTAVAGVVQLVAPDAELVSYRALDGSLGSEVAVAQSILKATAEGAHIINLSLGALAMPEHAPISIEDALDQIPEDVLVVAAAGNSGTFALDYPAAFKRVIAVGATDVSDDDLAAEYSNRGWYVDVSTKGTVAAPFVECTVNHLGITGPNPTIVVTGTSFAAPAVSGQLAVYLSRGMKPSAAVDALYASGRDNDPDIGRIVRILDQD